MLQQSFAQPERNGNKFTPKKIYNTEYNQTLGKNHSISVYCNPVDSKQNMEKLSFSKLFSFYHWGR
jgi:hypothetical protein